MPPALFFFLQVALGYFVVHILGLLVLFLGKMQSHLL